MATATEKVTAAERLAHRPTTVRVPESLRFVIVEDNGGSYRWTIVGAAGRFLGQSEPFGSYAEAEHAARAIREVAGAALLDPRPVDHPPAELVAQLDSASEYDSDAERWLDEGGSFGRQEVAPWPAAR